MNPLDWPTVLLAKHAQHVALIHFPIALYIAAVALDLLGAWTKREDFAAAGYFNLSLPRFPFSQRFSLGWWLGNGSWTATGSRASCSGTFCLLAVPRSSSGRVGGSLTGPSGRSERLPQNGARHWNSLAFSSSCSRGTWEVFSAASTQTRERAFLSPRENAVELLKALGVRGGAE
jgi:hypothetical protein